MHKTQENIPQLRTKHDFFKKSFFPSTIKEWNNLGPHIRKSKSIGIFKSNILNFIRSKLNNVNYCHNPKWIGLLTRFRLGLSHLREHKFKHSFQNCLNPLCFYGNLPHLPTTYFTVLSLQTKDWSFWTKSKVLIVAYRNASIKRPGRLLNFLNF